MTTFKYDKENLFKEFKNATLKDQKSKKETYTNRLEFLKEHRDLKKRVNLSMNL